MVHSPLLLLLTFKVDGVLGILLSFGGFPLPALASIPYYFLNCLLLWLLFHFFFVKSLYLHLILISLILDGLRDTVPLKTGVDGWLLDLPSRAFLRFGGHSKCCLVFRVLVRARS